MTIKFIFQALDLRESKLSHVHLLFFKELPNLKAIDLSKNLLITIAVGALERNLKMESLKIDGNPLSCDIQMEMTLLLLKRRNIRAKLKNCRKHCEFLINSRLITDL